MVKRELGMKHLHVVAAMMLVVVMVFGGLACDGGKTGEDVNGEPEPSESLQISNVSVSNITGTSAAVTWVTDRPASSQVEYGTGTEYGSLSTMNNELASNHSVVVNGLAQETTYHFRVKSADADGHEAVSNDQTFETLVAPVDQPNVQFLDGGQTESYTYSADGKCASATIGVPLENTGGAGDVFVAIAPKDSDSVVASNVFHFDEGESATVYAGVSCPLPHFPSRYEWTCRVASSGDRSQGSMRLERGNGTVDWGLWDSNVIPNRSLLLAVWGSSSSDVLAVGERGLILHYDGMKWERMTSGTSEYLYAVWGSSSSDAFVAGASGTILHYNGSTWTSMNSGANSYLWDVWGSSSSDVFAVGSDGTILHYNGSTWSAMTSGTSDILEALWGSSSSDVFAVGSDGTILHYNGSTWSAMTSGITDWLQGVWGSSSSNVLAVGSSGTILHYNGSTWGAMTSGITDWLQGVWGSSSSSVLAVGSLGAAIRYDGSAWTPMNVGTSSRLCGVWGTSGTDVFIVGEGIILHYDGHSWEDVSP